MELHFNKQFLTNLEESNKKYYTEYSLDNINAPFLDKNYLEIVNNGKIIYSHTILPQCESFNDLEEGQYKFNCDMYEQLIPLKYSVRRENGQLNLNSVVFTQF